MHPDELKLGYRYRVSFADIEDNFSGQFEGYLESLEAHHSEGREPVVTLIKFREGHWITNPTSEEVKEIQ